MILMRMSGCGVSTGSIDWNDLSRCGDQLEDIDVLSDTGINWLGYRCR